MKSSSSRWRSFQKTVLVMALVGVGMMLDATGGGPSGGACPSGRVGRRPAGELNSLPRCGVLLVADREADTDRAGGAGSPGGPRRVVRGKAIGDCRGVGATLVRRSALSARCLMVVVVGGTLTVIIEPFLEVVLILAGEGGMPLGLARSWTELVLVLVLVVKDDFVVGGFTFWVLFGAFLFEVDDWLGDRKSLSSSKSSMGSS